ncbi:unnamed protein product [Durusdinium trenchii]|uniref:Solute carrier family 40 protein n=1 Tax=Durusdinium trenchii TaxID=1381693 RepID=A0ABP0NSB2_9DINO
MELDDPGKEETEEDGPGRLAERLRWLYLFAFWSQFKPSEPFLVDYLIEEKGIGSEEVYQDVLDLFVYSRLPFLILVGFCAEMESCGYRAILVLGAASGVLTVLLTRFGVQMCLQQAAQFTVSAAFASRVAVPSLAFTLCLPSQFQEAIHTVKAVMLFSNCCASALGELLRDGDWVPLKVLFDLSALGQVLSLMCAACLPVPRASVATPTASAISNTLEEHLLPRSPTAARCSPKSACEVFKALVQDVWLSLWLRRVMWWTAWALAMNPIHGLTLTYWQSMVRSKHILKDHNGYLSACMYLAASVLTLGAGGAWALQGSTSPLVLSSVFLAAYLLLGLSGADTRQLTVYGWIMLYQRLAGHLLSLVWLFRQV